MLFTNPDKTKLPTICEAVALLREMTDTLPKMQSMPYDGPCNEPFILTRTASMFSIKPNIQRSGCLYMGVPSLANPLTGRWWSHERNDFMIINVLQEELRIVMESHPMYCLFRDGFCGGIRVFNPYGIGMAYGQPSAMLPLTSDIEIAAFFATHKVDPVTGTSTPCGADDDTGMIYVFELRAPMPYIPGLSTVGKQPFARSGRARMFAYDTTKSMNFNTLPFVKGFEFRHDAAQSAEISTEFSNPQRNLFPKELIAGKFRTILTGRIVSRNAIDRNLRENPRDSRDVNIRRLEQAGYRIVDSLNLSFTTEELDAIWYNNVYDRWRDFWLDVSLANVPRKIAETIIDLPNVNLYSRYFR